MIFPEFALENGRTLKDVPVAYKTWGELNKNADNAIVVCHSLTSDCDVESWWAPLVGPGKALDTEQYFVLCANAMGSPYGTVSPLSVDPLTETHYGLNFPVPTIRDTVNLHKKLLDKLGVKRIAFPIGGSMGGMQVLEWGFYGDFVLALAPIGVGGRHSAWCIGWSEAQRQAIYQDPAWNNGNYLLGEGPSGGLSIARMIAMISYRSFHSFQEKFGRTTVDKDKTALGHFSEAVGSDSDWVFSSDEERFSVEAYLHHQGGKLVDRFDANCYLRLTESMDSHDVSRGRGNYSEVLSRIRQPTLVIGIDSDILYPLDEQKELSTYLPNATLEVLVSDHGHDSFLIETETVNRIVTEWRQTIVEPLLRKNK